MICASETKKCSPKVQISRFDGTSEIYFVSLCFSCQKLLDNNRAAGRYTVNEDEYICRIVVASR